MSIISKETLVEKMKQYPTLLQQVMVMLDALGECLTTVNQYETDTKQAISDSKEAKENSATALTNSTEAKANSADAVKKVNDITYDTKELMSNNKDNIATYNFSLDLTNVNKNDTIDLGDITINTDKVVFDSKIGEDKAIFSFASIYTKFVSETDIDNITYSPDNFNRGDIILITCSTPPASVAPLSLTFTSSTTKTEGTMNANSIVLIKCDGEHFLVIFTTGYKGSYMNCYTAMKTNITIKSVEENVYFTPITISAYNDNY